VTAITNGMEVPVLYVLILALIMEFATYREIVSAMVIGMETHVLLVRPIGLVQIVLCAICIVEMVSVVILEPAYVILTHGTNILEIFVNVQHSVSHR